MARLIPDPTATPETETPNTGYRTSEKVEKQLALFKKAYPDLVDYTQKLPRERLENAYILSHGFKRQEQEAYRNKVLTALDKPENAELKSQIAAIPGVDLTTEEGRRQGFKAAYPQVKAGKLKL